MEKVAAPPILMQRKRDLSYGVVAGSPSESWKWEWDSVRFAGKPPSDDVVFEEESVAAVAPLQLNLAGRVSGGGNKRVRSGSPGTATYPMCQVDNCREDLSKAKDYHRRHKVCEAHSKASKALLSNQMQRFCQQCSRFHPLSEFDEGKRSCRRRLAGHNRRRRKTQPEDVTSATQVPAAAVAAAANLEIFNLLTAIAGASQGKFEERSQVPDREQLVQILNRIPLPADLATKLRDAGNVNGKKDHVQSETPSSYHHHDQLNHTPATPLTMDLLAVLSTSLSGSGPDANASPSQNRSCSSDGGSVKSRSSADQTRQQHFFSVGGERSSSSSQSPVEDSDCQEDVRVNLPLQLFSSSPEEDSLPKLASSRKYFSSDSSNPAEERSPSSSPPSPPVVEMQFDLQGGATGLKPESISSGRGVNSNKEASQSHSCNISLDLFKGSNKRIQQPSWLQSVPFQAGYTSSGSDHSPPSLNSDAQDRTGRIMFKLFDKHPSHFPETLRAQIYSWLSNRPSDMESYIRPGCVVLSLYASMSSAAWEKLEENFLQHVHSLIQNSDSDFWRSGRFLVHSGSQLASHKDGKVRICKPWRTWKSPELISVSPLAIVSRQETSISLKGRNLSTPGTKIHCTGTGSYSSAEVIRSSYPGVVYDNIKLSGFKVQDVSPGVVGRFFIEIENGFKGNSFPVIIANETICNELRLLESEFNEEEKICDAISEEHEHNFGRPRSREEALHFLNELGWLFQRERFSYMHEVPCYSLDRFKFVLTFAVERNCCMLVKTLLDVLVDKHLQGESLSTGSVEMLNAIQLLNRAVKRKNIGMVDLLIHYSLPNKNSTSSKYVFPPNLEGPAGITPLHLAACTSGSEGVVDSLTSDPQEIGLKCWESLVDANGQTPHAYAMMRNNNSYNVLVARKLADRRRAEISVTIENEVEQASLRVELNQKQSNLLKRGQSSCAKCATAEIRYNRRFSGSHGLLHRPFIYSMLAVAAVCVCVCVFFRGRPCVGSVAPFSWETLDFGTM
ncbi:squamosa promoter-binding-like protein 14 [Vigna radiata var. radiata]|uniref:Squamosa promoter-binding-like protein 14 n=1 Tax=Vigna radiata var. radiata TaxID=3916 RepID=A0A1S3VR29_VIGRR|nr:squamosa promoter-binding-like protein 14 [Vigna radiata var. radiata]